MILGNNLRSSDFWMSQVGLGWVWIFACIDTFRVLLSPKMSWQAIHRKDICLCEQDMECEVTKAVTTRPISWVMRG